MRRVALGTILTLALAALAVGADAPQASADAAVDVGLTGFRDILVDEDHGHVFVSQGNSTLVVTDLQGAPVTRIGDLYGAWGMTLGPDGSVLYVALSAGDAIAAIDTSSLEVTQVFPTGTATCPRDVAVTAGLVWFSGTCDDQWGPLRAVDPADGAVSRTLLTMHDLMIETSPELPGQLFAVEQGITPSTIYAYTARGGDNPGLTLRTSRRGPGSFARDIVITPDGSKLIQASGSPYTHDAYLTSDLSSAGTYASNAYPNAVAVRSDGMVAAGISGGTYLRDVYLYKAGSFTLLESYEFGGIENVLRTRGLAFGRTNLYAVTWDIHNNNNYRLQVITPVGVPSLLLTTDRSTYLAGDTAHVTASLVADSGNQNVSISAVAGGRTSLLVSGPVDQGHELTADLVVTEPTTFVAEYAGDPTMSSATATRDVDVSLRSTTLTLDSDQSVHRYGTTAHLTATLDSGSPNQHVSIFATVNGARSLVTEGEVDNNGTLTADRVITESTTFSAEYAGDGMYAPASSSRSVDMVLNDAAVSLTTDKNRYDYRELAAATVRLQTASSNRTVRLYRTSGGTTTLVESGEVPAGGALRLGARLRERSRLRVVYEGDVGTRSAAASVTVKVAARVQATLHGFDRRSGRYRIFPSGDPVRVGSSVSPHHAGQCLFFEVQSLVNGSFRDDRESGCVQMNRASEAEWRYRTTRQARGHSIRVRAVWRRDDRNSTSASPWRYARFT